MDENLRADRGLPIEGSVPARRREFDVLGMAIVLSLVFFHTASIFSGNQLVVNQGQTMAETLVALLVVSLEALWAMPVMMLIAGVALWHSLGSRTASGIVAERTRRLVVPLLTGMILLVPPQIYYWLRRDPSFQLDYLQFYPRFWDVEFSLPAFPTFFRSASGETIFNVLHLWFLLYLFVYTLLLLPLLLYLKGRPGRRLVISFASFFSRSWAIYLLALPIAAVEAVLGTEWPGGWNRFVWPFFVLYGFLLAGDARFDRVLALHWRRALVLGILTYLLYFLGMGALSEAAQVDPNVEQGPAGALVRFAKGVASWLWVLAVVGLAVRLSGRGQPASRDEGIGTEPPPPARVKAPAGDPLRKRLAAYAQQAQLPYYVLHQLPIIVIGYYVVEWEITSLFKFLVISFSSLAITLALYDIGVRRIEVTRFLFGMRPRRREPEGEMAM